MPTTIAAGLRTALGRLLAALLVPCLSIAQAPADPDAAPDLSEYGVHYSRYEPTFYTGFAPRAEDPEHLHLHVGRGNQLRITLVLSDRLLEGYARDLLARYETYRRLIGSGRLILTQNSGFEAYAQTLDDIDLAAWVEAASAMPAEAVRARNLDLMTRLNPGRVFSIRMPVDALIGQWIAELRPEDRLRPSRERQLELLNQMLPTRLWVTELDPGVAEDLEALIAQVPEQGEASVGDLSNAYLALLDRISHGIYPREGEELRFAELTAIHPVGTFNAYTSYRGRQIPQYPTPGRRALTYHQRTRTVDHIPDVVVYSYSPWIPYMHVGARLHNAFHTLWWRMDPARTDFLPPALRGADRATREGARYEHIWLLSRGPMSHGCTHVNTGHIAELRQILPAAPEQMERVDTFINKSHLYDVFDIDGDLEPEVMGVRYFVAYSLRDKRPDRLRAPIERRAFYAWLYGGELEYEPDGTSYFEDIRDGRFVGRQAVDGRRYGRIPLHEAAYEPERVQFYRLVDIPFARELRRVGAEYPIAEQGGTATETTR